MLIAEEYSEETIRERGLDPQVKVIRQGEFNEIDLSKFKTVCIDYVELVDQDVLQNIILKSSEKDLRIIALSQMRRDFEIHNIFGSEEWD